MSDPVTKLAYQTMQQGKSLLGLAHKEVSTRLMDLVAPQASASTVPVPPEMMGELRSSMDELLELDWKEAQQGLYPTSLLFDAPWLDWAVRYPLVWLDLPSIWQRRTRRDVTDLPVEINPKDYPDYYLQNFHHQTDGYLSDRSAELYDLQVEILFNGTADAMRRRLIRPLLDQLGGRRADPIRVLDIATSRYEGGATPYLDVITAQQALLNSERQAAQLMGQRLLVSVFLIKALGGDWHARREETPLVQSKTLSSAEK